MKRIGVLLSAGPGGGVLQYSQAIVDAAMALPQEYALSAAIADPLWEGVLPERMSIMRLRDTAWNRALNRIAHMTRLPVAAWRKTLAHLDSNVKALQREGCDLWICPNHDRYSFRAQIPALGTVHDLMHRYERQFPEVSANGEFESREFHFSETARWSRGVLVDSELGKNQLVESYGIAPEKVFVLPYIAPSYIYEYDGGNDTAVRSKYSLPEKFFFYPAQFYQHKNHATLIDAVARMREQYPDVRLVLVGARERNSYDDIKRQVERLGLTGIVLFLGYAPDSDMAALYRAARALVMPTYFGPTNIPQLEAFALGCPVATSRIYGIPDQVGNAALLFDPSSADEIHDYLVRLWTDDDLCAELGRRGREHAARWGPPQFRERFRQIVEALT
ncbi:MAG: glycosyltransferase family 1 protein [Gemmatimonadaceae bacterium]|nr:glycosyltransferase family 1 protein [Gemmatimonadaceae bacterium]